MCANKSAPGRFQPQPQDSPTTTPDVQPVIRRRRVRYVVCLLAVAVLVLTGLLGAVLLNRSAVINLLAPFFLSRAGLQEVAFHLYDIDASHVRVDYATGLVPLEHGAVRVALEQVEYDFSIGQMLAGKVERFKVGRMELHLPAWTSPPAADEEAQQAPFPERFLRFLDTIKALPVESLRIENLVLHASIDGHVYTAPACMLEYSAAPGGGTLSLQELPKDGQTTALTLELGLEDKQIKASLDADLAGLQDSLPQQLRMRLPLDRGRVEVQALISQERAQLRTAMLRAHGKHIGNARWQAETLALNLTATSPPGSEDLVLADDSRLTLQGLKLQSLQLEAGLVPLQGVVHFLPHGVQAQWQPREALQLSGLLMGEIRLAALAVHHALAQVEIAPGGLQAAAGEKARIALDPGTRLEMQRLSAPGLHVDALQASLPLEVQLFHNRQELQWRPAAPLVITGLKAGAAAFAPMRIGNIELLLQKNPEASRVEADFLLPAIGGAFHLNWHHGAAGATNKLTVQTAKPLKLGPDTSPLHLLAKPSSALGAVTIEQGALGARLLLNWGPLPMAARLDLDVHDMAASHANLRCRGMSLQHSLQIMPQLRSVQTGRLAVAAVEGPVSLADLLVRFQLLSPGKGGGMPTLLIGEGSLHVFGGKVELANCRYNPQRSNTCTFSLHNLDLAAVLALHRIEGLEVSGRVNGRLPVRHDQTGFSMTEGVLTNTGDGVIRYRPSSTALATSPYSEYVLKALEDYRYHSLAASLSYQSDGSLIAGLHLQGNSPQLATRRPVHLNLQTEQNLLSLLKSLQYSQGLNSELNRRVQDRFQPKQTK